MTFALPSRSFSAAYERDDPSNSECRLYQIKEFAEGRVLRTFTGSVTRTQAVRKNVERVVERWCELFPEKLPKNGEAVSIDLDYVERIVDRR